MDLQPMELGNTDLQQKALLIRLPHCGFYLPLAFHITRVQNSLHCSHTVFYEAAFRSAGTATSLTDHTAKSHEIFNISISLLLRQAGMRMGSVYLTLPGEKTVNFCLKAQAPRNSVSSSVILPPPSRLPVPVGFLKGIIALSSG